MKTIYINAGIDNRMENAFMVEDDHFSRFGSTQQLLAERDGQESVVDLCGAYVIPGLVNANMHLLQYGMELSQWNLENIDSKEELMECLHRQALGQDDAWIIGRGFCQNKFPLPKREELDAVCGRHPLALTSKCGQKMLVNQKAFAKAGIDEKQIMTSEMISYEDGMVLGAAKEKIKAAMPSPNVETMKSWIVTGMCALNQMGITTVGTNDFGSINADWHTILDAYGQLSYQEKMTVRVNELCAFHSSKELALYLDEGYGMGIGDAMVTMGPLVLKAGVKDQELRLFAQLAAKFNTPSICYADDAKEVDQILRIMQDIVLEGNPLHQAMVYRGSLSDDQQLWLRQLHMDMVVDLVCEENRAFPFASLWDVCNIAYGAQTPKNFFDMQETIFNRKEISPAQALKACTENGARLFMANEIYGFLDSGKKADFTVLSADIKQAASKQNEVLRTVVDGKTVFEKQSR